MRSRLGIAISELDLMSAAASEEGQSLHDHILALSYRCVFDVGEAATCKTLFSREVEHDRTAYINGMLRPLTMSHSIRGRKRVPNRKLSGKRPFQRFALPVKLEVTPTSQSNR